MAGRLDGVSELALKLLELGKLEDGKALSQACRAGMLPVLEQAKRTIPVSELPTRLTKTYGRQTVAGGYAQRNLRLVTKRFDGQRSSAVVSTSKRAFYVTQFEEFGTRHMRQFPWLRNALYTSRDASEAAFKQSLADSVERIARRK